SGTSQVYYHDGDEAFLYKGNPAVWMYGLSFPTTVWQKHPFEDISKGVDTRWLKDHIPAAARYDCDDPGMSIATIHATNTCKKHTVGREWSHVDHLLLLKAMLEEK